MRNEPIKVGVIGVGHLGQHHVKHYVSLKDANLVGIVDTTKHSWLWAQAGDKFEPEPGAKPDLALGIWQHANFREHRIEHLHKLHCGYENTELIVTAVPQTV